MPLYLRALYRTKAGRAILLAGLVWLLHRIPGMAAITTDQVGAMLDAILGGGITGEAVADGLVGLSLLYGTLYGNETVADVRRLLHVPQYDVTSQDNVKLQMRLVAGKPTKIISYRLADNGLVAVTEAGRVTLSPVSALDEHTYRIWAMLQDQASPPHSTGEEKTNG